MILGILMLIIKELQILIEMQKEKSFLIERKYWKKMGGRIVPVLEDFK